jgi:hypothetical protein
LQKRKRSVFRVEEEDTRGKESIGGQELVLTASNWETIADRIAKIG